MRLLGAGELTGLKARGLAKQERDPILRNERLRSERQRAHMRALIAVPPAKFRPGELGRIERFHVELVRVAPAQHQLPAEQLPAALEPVRSGIALHLGRDERGIGFVFSQAIGPWSVRFSVHEDAPTQSSDEAALNFVDPEGT